MGKTGLMHSIYYRKNRSFLLDCWEQKSSAEYSLLPTLR